MKTTPFFFLLLITQFSTFAQLKEFEGTIVYQVGVKSKVEGVSDNTWRNGLALGDNLTTIIRQGNYKQTTGPTEIYTIAKDKKTYLKFQGIDTLYYLDYASDTSAVLNVQKSEDKKNIAGFDCRSITIKTHSATRNYYYAPTLYLNPEYSKDNTIEQYNVFAEKTSSVYLSTEEEKESYKTSLTAISVKQEPVNEKIFELPALPQKIFTDDAIIKRPKFARAGGLSKYIELYIKGDLGAKYIKIPKGEESAIQTAIVVFMINEEGRTVKAHVINKDDVHPKLAEEAIRVISTAPTWIPGTVLGKPIITWFKQPITFMASRH